MGKNQNELITNLLRGINSQGDKILQHAKQFYSTQQNKVVTVFQIDRAVWDEKTQKYKNNELFKTASQIQVVLFLRDLLYINQGRKLPIDNEIWNKKRQEITYFQTLEKPLEEYLENDNR